ncbi:MAG: polysaccharide deacetylase family protein [Gammaproteobacteria bacterium]|nr:polysaccharide deacetylase family protein [Gammaproteobacteria bacterium]MBU1654180.1 polysaccharide deacetylase family protein [Gammaproteobacteria bacterium]MBU1961818.1 polysaccharide deacetylase family protein [Gammaproteobacteria bacterium]
MGSSNERRIRKLSGSDREPPPAEMIERAASLLRPLPSERQGSIRYVRVKGNRRLVALTFDLCEQGNEVAGYEGAIVDYLRHHKIKATFYAGGKWLRSHPERAMQLMADPLFEMGNHGWTHRNLRQIKGQAMEEQILWPQAQFALLRDQLSQRDCFRRASAQEQSRIQQLPTTFRFPFGVCSKDSLNAASRFGLAAVQWNIVSGDPWKRQTAQGIANAVLEGIRPGTIIVAHANGRGWKTAESLDLFIPKLRAQGYEFVTVSELLEAGEPYAATSCYEMRPGDNLRYDKPAGAPQYFVRDQ